MALASFQQIDECIYSNKSLGASKQLELMGCDCARLASGGKLCTEEFGCVNRLTSIECYGHSSCEGRCSNRRFQNKDFADIEVFDAGAKGYGVRSNQQLGEGQFVYEYIGEVIDKARFEKRKVTYEKEKVRHFYFMMLQKDEFIDATKKGSVARFLNHSCNPNCAVTKWVVGPKLRMGIFALRPIQPGEELTFDYNADRFGDNVQECLCGEPNCRGVLNGKTDAIDLIPRALWPILGLESETIETIRDEIKTNKLFKKKKELDSDIVTLVPNTPIAEPEQVNQIVTFLMQPQEEFLVSKVLDRIYSTQTQQIQAQLLKMHGYELFGTLLDQYKTNDKMVVEMLKVLEGWPRVTRNKISSSKIESVVQGLVSSSNQEVSDTAKALIAEWSELEMAYRIPRQKRDTSADVETSAEPVEESPASADKASSDLEPSSSLPLPPPKLPPGWSHAYNDGTIYYFNRAKNITQWNLPVEDDALECERKREREERRDREREKERERERQKELLKVKKQKEDEAAELQRIIEAANADTSITEAPLAIPVRTKLTQEERLERKFTHTLAAYVPKIVFKYQDKLDHDRCKKHAKEIVKVLVDKEVRKGVKEIDLNEAKKKKIKGFVSDYIKKLLEHKKTKEPKETKAESNPTGEPAKKKIKTN